jgi:hypothetical protein
MGQDAPRPEPETHPVIDAETIETPAAEAVREEAEAEAGAAEAKPKRRRAAAGSARKTAAPRKPRAIKAKGKKKE